MIIPITIKAIVCEFNFVSVAKYYITGKKDKNITRIVTLRVSPSNCKLSEVKAMTSE